MSLSLCTHLPLPFNICVIFQPHSRLKCNAAHYEPTTSHKSRILSAKIYTTAIRLQNCPCLFWICNPGFFTPVSHCLSSVPTALVTFIFLKVRCHSLNATDHRLVAYSVSRRKCKLVRKQVFVLLTRICLLHLPSARVTLP